MQLVSKYGSALRIAELIYKEKMFFAKHAPHIDRPRDDKSASLIRMVQEELQHVRAEHEAKEHSDFVEAGKCNSDAGKQDCKLSESEGLSPFHHLPEAPDSSAPDELAANTDASKPPQGFNYATTYASPSSRLYCSETEREHLMQRLNESWGSCMPKSMQRLYEHALSLLDTERSPEPSRHLFGSITFGKASSGTMPLRDLVKTLHHKSGKTEVMH
jgi:hypothetical protein